MQRVEDFLNKYWILAILILSIPASWALFVPGFYGASDEMHIGWLYQMDRVIKMGQIPPRFVPDLSFGFGYPLFNFAFPLPFYIAELIHLIGFSLVDSIKAVFFLSIPLSAISMYLLLRQLTNPVLSFLGSILYVYTPYRATDIYIRGTIGEIVSFIFLPLITLSIIKINKSKNLRWVGIGAIALAFLILSHNIAAYMFFPFITLFFILQFFLSKEKKSFLVRSFLMVFLGISTSSYFWLPAIIESSLVKYDTVFNFVDHFPTIRQLITPYWGYGASVPGPGDGLSFFLGYPNLIILTLGFILFIKKIKQQTMEKKLLMFWVFGGLSVVIFLMNYRSAFLWSNLPLLPYFQFPWRFLILTTFFVPFLLILFGDIEFKKPVYIIILVLTLLPTSFYFRPQDFLGRKDDYFLNRYIPVPVASSEYLKIQEEYLRLPKDVEKRPDQNYPLVFSDSGSIESITRIHDLHSIINVNSENGMNLNYTKYFFPGWIAKVNDEKAQVTPGKPFGQIQISIPKGRHKVEVSFQETSFKKLLDAISLGSFLVSLLMIQLWFRSKKAGSSS